MTNELNKQSNVDYLNKYVEVLNENLSLIIKQNIMLQTNLQIAENNLSILIEKEKNNSEVLNQSTFLVNQNKELTQKVSDLESLKSSYKTLSDDRTRLQIALNETSQHKNQLQNELNSANQELMRLRANSNENEKVKPAQKIAPSTQTITPKIEKKSKKTTNRATAGTF